MYPSSSSQALAIDIEQLMLESISDIVSNIHFAPKKVSDLKQLFFEFKELHEFACKTAAEFRNEGCVADKFYKIC